MNQRKYFGLIFCIIFVLSSCNSLNLNKTPISTPTISTTPIFTQTSTPSSTPSATATPTNTLTPSLTPTITSSPSTTPLPAEVISQTLGTYQTFIFELASAEMIEEISTSLRDGEISSFEAGINIIAIALIIDEFEKVFQEGEPIAILEAEWENVHEYHETMKDILARWFNDEINSTIVAEEIIPVAIDLEIIINRSEDILAAEYGFDKNELANYREEALEEFLEIINE